MIILSYTFHPYATKNYMATHSLIFRLFANVFFSLVIGMSWAFLASYSLKQSHKVAILANIQQLPEQVTLRDQEENL